MSFFRTCRVETNIAPRKYSVYTGGSKIRSSESALPPIPKLQIGIKLLPEAVFLITNHSVVIQQTGLIAMEINLDLTDNMNISMSRTFKFQWRYYNNSNKFIDKWLEGNPIQLLEA